MTQGSLISRQRQSPSPLRIQEKQYASESVLRRPGTLHVNHSLARRINCMHHSAGSGRSWADTPSGSMSTTRSPLTHPGRFPPASRCMWPSLINLGGTVDGMGSIFSTISPTHIRDRTSHSCFCSKRLAAGGPSSRPCRQAGGGRLTCGLHNSPPLPVPLVDILASIKPHAAGTHTTHPLPHVCKSSAGQHHFPVIPSQ